MRHKKSISSDLLARFSQFLAEKMGWYFPEKQIPDLEKKLLPTIEALGFQDPHTCYDYLITNQLTQEQISIFAHHFTIGETYFFRDSHFFKILESKILPQIIHKHSQTDKHIKIWCSACCTGEEPYSIAILLHQMLPNLSQWTIDIIATDINPNFLHKARQAIYKNWSFRSIPAHLKLKYFIEEKPEKFRLKPEIQKMVQFKLLNLVEDTYPSSTNGIYALDLILCNNVLIYFAQAQINQVTRKIACSLAQGGYFIVSPIEVPYIIDPTLSTIKFDNTTVFRKGDRSSHPEKREHGLENPSPSIFDQPKHIHMNPVTTQRTDANSYKIELPAFLGLKNPFLEIHLSPQSACLPEKSLVQPINYDASRASQPEKKTPQITEEQEKTIEDRWLKLFLSGQYKDLIRQLEPELINCLKNRSFSETDLCHLILLIKSYLNLKDYTQAHLWCNKGLSLDKLNPALYFLQATACQELNLPQEAYEALRTALYLDDDFLIAHFAMGNLLLRMGHSHEAKKYFRNTQHLLRKYEEDQLIPETDGLTAARLIELVKMMDKE